MIPVSKIKEWRKHTNTALRLINEYCHYACWEEYHEDLSLEEMKNDFEHNYDDAHIVGFDRKKVIAQYAGHHYYVPESYLTDSKYRKSFKYDVEKNMKTLHEEWASEDKQIEMKSELNELKSLIDKHRDKAKNYLGV